MWNRKQGFYEKYVKRVFDFSCSILAIAVFSWLYLIIAIVRAMCYDKSTGNYSFGKGLIT